jgi:hypothetical protein
MVCKALSLPAPLKDVASLLPCITDRNDLGLVCYEYYKAMLRGLTVYRETRSHDPPVLDVGHILIIVKRMVRKYIESVGELGALILVQKS